MNILRQDKAMRVIFFSPGEEGTYVDHPEVTVYDNGIVWIKTDKEDTMVHIHNCEICWKFEENPQGLFGKLRLFKPELNE